MQLFQVQPLGFLIKPLELEEVEKILDKCIQLYEIRNQKFEYKFCIFIAKIRK